MKSLTQANIQAGTKVIVASDIDVPIENGIILEPFRLENILPSLKYIIQKGGFPIIAGHIGQPKNGYEESLSTKPLQTYFEKTLQTNSFELLENLRFDAGEETNNLDYTKGLASKAQIYVNENFSTSHREHASIVGLPKLLPAYAGLRLEKEIQTLGTLVTNPQKPFVCVIGGAKIESKKPVLTKLLTVADQVLVGGKIGLEWTETLPNNLLIPGDYAPEQKDIGNETIQKYIQIIEQAKTILWAGPMGLYEDPQFINGTKSIAQAIVNASKSGATSIIGGGDTITAANTLGILNDFSFVSCGGGAMLTFLAQGTLPGIQALND